MSRTWLGKALRLTTSYMTQVLLSAPEPRWGRQTPGPDPERATFPPAHPHPHPHTFVPTAAATVTMCSLVGPPGASVWAGPWIWGTGAGAGLTVWHCTWH